MVLAIGHDADFLEKCVSLITQLLGGRKLTPEMQFVEGTIKVLKAHAIKFGSVGQHMVRLGIVKVTGESIFRQAMYAFETDADDMLLTVKCRLFPNDTPKDISHNDIKLPGDCVLVVQQILPLVIHACCFLLGLSRWRPTLQRSLPRHSTSAFVFLLDSIP